MIVEIIDAGTAIPEINVKDIDAGEDCTWLYGLTQYIEYQHDYWQYYRHYAKSLENLVNDKEN